APDRALGERGAALLLLGEERLLERRLVHTGDPEDPRAATARGERDRERDVRGRLAESRQGRLELRLSGGRERGPTEARLRRRGAAQGVGEEGLEVLRLARQARDSNARQRRRRLRARGGARLRGARGGGRSRLGRGSGAGDRRRGRAATPQH